MKDYKTLYGSLVSGDWPNTVAKNASGPSASDGTPYSKDIIDDIWGGRIDLMVRAGIAPDGVTEGNGTSQFVDALERVVRGPGEIVFSALNAAERAKRRIILLTGQVLTIASYARLCASVYCGDAANATAPAFFKTSDAGGTTRSTAGAYMVMPDAQGLVVRGKGSNTKIFAANGSAYSGGTAIAAYLTDMLQGHWHNAYGGGGGTASLGNNIPILGATTALANFTGNIQNPVIDGVNGATRYGAETRGASIAFDIGITY